MNSPSVTDRDPVNIHRRDQSESTTFGSKLRQLFFVAIPFLLPVVRNLPIMLACAYRLAIFCLPEYYAAQAATAAGDSLLQESLASSLVEHWRMFNIISGILLPIVIGMVKFQSTALQTAGFVSLACAFISFVISSMLLVTIGASPRMHCDVPANLSNGGGERVNADVTDPERQQTVPAGTNNHHHLWGTFFDTARPLSAGWNIYVLVALPAIWTAWSVIAFTVLLLLFAWNLGGSTVTPNPTGPTTFASPVNIFVQMSFKEVLLPGIAASVILIAGGIYLALTLCALRRPAQ